MKSKKIARPRRSFVVTFSAVACLSAAGGCGGSVDAEVGGPNPPPPDGGANDGNPAACPASPPTSSTACDVPEATCSYSAGCSTSFFTCNAGHWQEAIGNPPRPICPAAQPVTGSSCDVCAYPSSLDCPYKIGECNGQDIDAHAQCIAGKWQIVGGSSCNPPAPDAGTDASFVDAASGDASSSDGGGD
jgi:hypothetical protein